MSGEIPKLEHKEAPLDIVFDRLKLKALKPQTLLKNTRFKVPSTAQNTSSKSIITTREPDQEPSANIPDQSETNAMAQNTQDTTAEDTTAQNITSTLDALHLDPPITPPETVESLRAYEKGPGEAQKFLGDMDREIVANFLYFYNSLETDEHQKDWSMVDPLLREKYLHPVPASKGGEISAFQLWRTPALDNNKLYKTTDAPETILPYTIRRGLGKKVSIGDDNWVKLNILRVWEAKPGDQVDSSLIGDDV
ncbi:367_t:CDS:2 [Paraglomus brasilianum]|uniref:367_t:CDS:1 n=1 Tax=Paraglomus brasilianum TaxID=144538 RepID=A0A9N9D6H0_9GLOM|nr:367_t:CDS:2 [Paraglomus brasilianum]